MRQSMSDTFADRDFQAAAEKQVGFQVDQYDASKPLTIDPVIVYQTPWGGSGDEAAYAVAVGSDGALYLTGSTTSTNFPTQGACRSTAVPLYARYRLSGKRGSGPL